MDMLKNRNVMAGVVFVLTTGIVMASLFVAKPAFCCQVPVNSSDPVKVNWGIVSGMSVGIGAVAAGVSFLLMPAGAVAGAAPALAPAVAPAPMGFRFAMHGTPKMNMGGSCKMGCGI